MTGKWWYCQIDELLYCYTTKKIHVTIFLRLLIFSTMFH